MISIEEFGRILNKINKNKVSDDFWKKEKESFKSLDEENSKIEHETKMSNEAFTREFNI